MVKVLAVNSPIFAYDHIVTGDDGSLSIVLDGDPPAHLDIGSSNDILVDEDVFGEAAPVDIAAAAAATEDVRAILDELDVTLSDAPADEEPSGEAGFHPDVSFEEAAPALSDDYQLVSDDAGKAKVVFYDGDHHEIGSVTFDSVDYDPDLDVNTLLGQIDADDPHGA
jgi:hypothetical protein